MHAWSSDFPATPSQPPCPHDKNHRPFVVSSMLEGAVKQRKFGIIAIGGWQCVFVKKELSNHI